MPQLVPVDWLSVCQNLTDGGSTSCSFSVRESVEERGLARPRWAHDSDQLPSLYAAICITEDGEGLLSDSVFDRDVHALPPKAPNNVVNEMSGRNGIQL